MANGNRKRSENSTGRWSKKDSSTTNCSFQFMSLLQRENVGGPWWCSRKSPRRAHCRVVATGATARFVSAIESGAKAKGKYLRTAIN
jgi:hypothetical protein